MSQLILTMRNEGKTANQIAAELNARKIKTTYGKRWTAGNVRAQYTRKPRAGRKATNQSVQDALEVLNSNLTTTLKIRTLSALFQIQ